MVWVKFILCAVIIIFAGTRLAKYADAIAEKTGLGRLWIGLLVLAFITAMPEMVTALSSAALVEVPDLAVGALLGSCPFNLAIIAVLDISHKAGPILSKVSSTHLISAGMGALLIALVGGGILVGGRFPEVAVGWVSIPSVIVPLLYLVGAKQIFRAEQNEESKTRVAEPRQYDRISSRAVYLGFALSAAAVIGAGIWLSFIGDEISRTTGWGAGFVGSLLIAITTSMPELVVTISALRLGSPDMAIGDILGANMLDIMAITWADLAYTKGPILSAVSNSHLITTVLTITMSLLVIVAIRFRQQRKTFGVISWYGVVFIMLYLVGAYALFTSGLGLD